MTKHLVRDLMTTKVMTLRPWQPLLKAYDAMTKCSRRHAPVIDESGKVVGVLTQQDVARRILYPCEEVSPSQHRESLNLLKVNDIMSKNVESVSPYDSLASAAALILEKKFNCLPVVLNGDLVGIITEADFVGLALAHDVEEDFRDSYEERSSFHTNA